MACKILVLQPGFKLVLSAVKAKSPNHWTASEFPKAVLFYFPSNSYLEIPFGTGLSCQHQNPLSATRVCEPNSVTLYVHPAFLLFFFSFFLFWPLSAACGILVSHQGSNPCPCCSEKGKRGMSFPVSLS